MSSVKKQIDINSIITMEKKNMFLNLDDKLKTKKHTQKHQLILDTLFDDKKILYNSNINIDTKT